MSVPWSEKFCPEPGPLETLTVFDKLSSRGQGGAGESEAASPAGLTQGRQWGWTEGSLPREVMKPQLIKQVCRGGEGRLSKSPPPPLLPWGADGWWGHQLNFERETSH